MRVPRASGCWRVDISTVTGDDGPIEPGTASLLLRRGCDRPRSHLPWRARRQATGSGVAAGVQRHHGRSGRRSRLRPGPGRSLRPEPRSDRGGGGRQRGDGQSGLRTSGCGSGLRYPSAPLRTIIPWRRTGLHLPHPPAEREVGRGTGRGPSDAPTGGHLLFPVHQGHGHVEQSAFLWHAVPFVATLLSLDELVGAVRRSGFDRTTSRGTIRWNPHTGLAASTSRP